GLNRGAFDPTAGVWSGHGAVELNTSFRRWKDRTDIALLNQWISDNFVQTEKDLRGAVETGGAKVGFWLAAPKRTDVLMLAPAQPSRNALEDFVAVDDPAATGQALLDIMRRTGVRAAAVSAASILASKATLHLDLDVEELDV